MRSLLLVSAVALSFFCYCRAQDDNTETGVNAGIDIGFFGGDVKLTQSQMNDMRMSLPIRAGLFIQNAVLRPELFDVWPNAVVPYIFDTSIEDTAQTAINAAISAYSADTCIRLVQRSDETDYVRFIKGQGCYSYIGRIGGEQNISIGAGCEFVGIVIHEIFHALGRFHEQSRPDRDLYVRINRQNIISGFEDNFDVAEERYVTTQGIDYDYGSVMHYSAYGFTSNRQPTIEPIQQGISLGDLGQREGLSMSDIKHARVLYNCVQEQAEWSTWSSWSSCSQTCNGGSRTRTRTCENGDNCVGSNIETEDCNTDACPTPPQWGEWAAWSKCSEPCGTGSRQRSRECIGGNTCETLSGELGEEFEDCNTQACPQPTEWSNWGSWGECSKTCATGERTRRRNCLNGNTCDGLDFQSESCNGGVACQPDPGDGEWSQWSACSQTCGGGTRSRRRNCGMSVCNSETEPCSQDECPVTESRLRGIRHVGCYSVPTFATPLRLIERTTPDLSDNPFTRQEPKRKCGEGATKASYNYFALTLGLCISGSNELRDYQTFQADGFCSNDKGGYALGFYFMDVYELFDLQSFADSAAGIVQPSPSPTMGDVPDGASVPSVMIFTLTLLVVLTFALFI